MMDRRCAVLPFALCAAFSLWTSGCGGRATGTLGTNPQASQQTALVQFYIVVPRSTSARVRRPTYVSPSTASATITVAPGTATTTVNCTNVCSASIAAPIGSDTFTVNLYDGLNGTGNLLSTGTLTQTIVAGQANTANLTFNGVVSSLAISIDPVTVLNGRPDTIAVDVNALDVDGNIIVAPGSYSDSNGNPLTLTLHDSDSSGATHLSVTALTAPTSGITLSYNGAYISMNPTISVTAPRLVTAQAKLVAFTEYPIPIPSATPSATFGITAGPDGALWFTQFVGNGNSFIGRVTTSGAFTEYPLGGPYGIRITTGPDGALWFTEGQPNAAAGAIGRMTTAGTSTGYPIPTPSNGPCQGCNPYGSPNGITTGPDGALWFTEYYDKTGPHYLTAFSEIGRVTTTGAFTEYPLPNPGSAPGGIITGPDGALWFTEGGISAIGRMTTSGALTEYPGHTNIGGGITTGPDGAIWFTEGGKIGRVTTAGVFTEYPLPIPYSSARGGITTGPDGALWFTESDQGASKIGRLTTAGAFTFYPVGNTPSDITTGPDGALWFIDYNVNQIGRISP